MNSLVPPDIPASLDGNLKPDQEMRVGGDVLQPTVQSDRESVSLVQKVTQKPNQQTKCDIMGLANLASLENVAALAQPKSCIIRVHSRKCRLRKQKEATSRAPVQQSQIHVGV